MLPVFDRDWQIPVEALAMLAETGMLQQTTQDWDKSVEVKQQVIQ